MPHDPSNDEDTTFVRVRDVAMQYLTNWRFWITVAFFGLIIAIWVGGTALQHADQASAREQSDAAARKAAAAAQYQQCLAGRPQLEKINRFIEGVRGVGDVLLLNSIQVHDVTPPGTAMYQQQKTNIKRLRKALNNQAAVVHFPVPTKAECAARAHG